MKGFRSHHHPASLDFFLAQHPQTFTEAVVQQAVLFGQRISLRASAQTACWRFRPTSTLTVSRLRMLAPMPTANAGP